MTGHTSRTASPLSADPVRTGTLRYPAGSLVILTGLPGAGKSTLLRRLYGLDGSETAPVVAGGVTVIDSMQSRLRWAGSFGWVPKPARTALVFATHLWRIRRGLAAGPVIAHNRGCGPVVLRLFARLARRRGVAFHLLLLDASPEAALAGQRARDRVVGARTFSYHRRRWEALLARARAGAAAPAAGATVIDRRAADLLGGMGGPGAMGGMGGMDGMDGPGGIVFDATPASPAGRAKPSTINR
ncbi:ATP-binding protein [Nonomuraea sp. SMC257]|uniref:ATP-binding protein n=1 Tax=Nonomuraea montanisoli TaxID=2741721 RepID=A0A7Y6I5X6_9ACTN|nr:AAA family ATPase [Nonomuraea montanisoli]NUW32159.1 ATP-binding protein [Nonomuraea montanisoli]